MSLFQAASQKLPGARNAEGKLVTDGFLDACQLVVPVIGAVEGAELAAAASKQLLFLTWGRSCCRAVRFWICTGKE